MAKKNPKFLNPIHFRTGDEVGVYGPIPNTKHDNSFKGDIVKIQVVSYPYATCQRRGNFEVSEGHIDLRNYRFIELEQAYIDSLDAIRKRRK